MFKSLIGSAAAALILTSTLQAHPIAPDEVKQFAAQALQIDFDKAPAEVQKNITDQYTKRVQLAETIAAKLKNDSEYIRMSESLALDIWSKRIVDTIHPTDDELKKLYDATSDLNVPASYKLRHIIVTNETDADSIVNQLNTKTADEQIKTFTTLASTYSQDQKTKQLGGYIGWVESSTLPTVVRDAFKDKTSGSVIKLSPNKDMWDVLMIDDIKPEHRATFEESKNYLLNMMRQHAVEEEAKKLMNASAAKPAAKTKKGK